MIGQGSEDTHSGFNQTTGDVERSVRIASGLPSLSSILLENCLYSQQ